MKKYKNICLSLIFVSMMLMGINIHAANEHHFGFEAYDFDITANDWEGDGSYAPITSGDDVEPGQVFEFHLTYNAGLPNVLGFQGSIEFNPNQLEVIYPPGEDEAYFDFLLMPPTTGGIWPPAGSVGAARNRTNWAMAPNATNNQVIYTAYDTQGAAYFTGGGSVVTFYFRVKDNLSSGTIITVNYVNSETKVVDNVGTKLLDTFVLNVFGSMSDDNTLSVLEIKKGTTTYPLNPVFVPGSKVNKEFNTVVPNNITDIDLNAVVNDPYATIINGPGNKALNVGDNSFQIIVQSQNLSIETYTVNIKRLNNDASLSSLTLINSDIAIPSFDPNTMIYNMTVPYRINSTNVNPTLNNIDATLVSGNGTWNLTNYGITINTREIIVNAEDCKSEYQSVTGNTCSSKTYTLNITREAPSTDATLSDLKVNGATINGFNPNILEYTYQTVNSDVTSLLIAATLNETNATITSGLGNINISMGDNTLNVVVTAEDGVTTKTYKIDVRRKSNNANLASLVVTSNPNGTFAPSFSPTFYDYYTYSVDPSVSTVNISATLADSSASITSGLGDHSTSNNPLLEVIVTAEDGTIAIYKIKIQRALSSNNNLSSLTVSEGILTPSFIPTNTLYTVNVAGDITSIDVGGLVEDTGKASIISGLGSHNLNVGNNTIQVRVQAENGATKDYTITVNRAAKANADLTNLTVDSVSVPNFDKDTLNYTLSDVPYSKTSVVVGATKSDSDATITGLGTISLNTGSNAIKVEVTAEDGVTKKIYTININRAKNNEARLSDLNITGYILNETFDSDTYLYTLTVPNNITVINESMVTALAIDSNAIVTKLNSLSLSTTSINIYTIDIIAEDGLTTKQYTINITREKSNNAYLSNLTTNIGLLNPAFNKTLNNYSVTVSRDVETIVFTPTVEISTSNAVINGPSILMVGNNAFTIEVTAEDGTVNIYNINVIREKSNNNYLRDLKVDGTTISGFDKDITSYTLNVTSDVSEIEVEATAEFATATISGTGTYPLVAGVKQISIEVTAEDGNKRTYTITVNKAKSSDNKLISLTIPPGLLNETFNPDTLTYTASVSNSVEKIEIIATANDAKSIVSGLGEKNLNTGDNRFLVTVTAEDNTTRTYTITVTRAKSTNAKLNNILVSGGYSLSPSFDPDTLNYQINVPNEAAAIQVTPEKQDIKASVSGGGIINLNTGDNLVEINVTAEDGVTKLKYSIVVNRAGSSNAYLSSLSTPSGTIIPTFEKETTYYAVTVPYEVSDITFSANPEDAKANVSIVGNENLIVGDNTVQIIVTAESGNVKTYTVLVTRQPSANNFLSNISVKDLNDFEYLTVFNKETLTYNIQVTNDTEKVILDAVVEDLNATITSTLGEKDLNVGQNRLEIEVKSANNITRTYVINVNRGYNSNNNLASLGVIDQVLNPTFDKDIISYTVNVDANVSIVTIEATSEVTTSTIEGLGVKNIYTGVNTFNVVVTSEAGTKKTYVIVVNKVASSNNNLAALNTNPSEYTPNFDANILNYEITVPNSVSTFEIEAIAEDAASSINGNGTFNLNVGKNDFNIIVTAEDNTTKTYKIEVTRQASSNNYLSDLRINGVTIPNFDKNTLEYTMNVENAIDGVEVLGISEVNTAVVTGNGDYPLVTTALNVITINVTAENGDTKTYRITITRAKSTNNYLQHLSALEGVIDPIFNKETLEYNITVPYEITSLNIIAVPEVVTASTEIEGNSNFQVGITNKVYVTVIPEEGAHRVYTINVTRSPQANNYLSNLIVIGNSGKTYNLDPNFDRNTLTYNVLLDYNEIAVNITATKESASSTVSGNGYVVIPATVPYQHKVIVTSVGGISRNYIINFTRELSNDATLLDLNVNKGILNPIFSSNVFNYEVEVESNIEDITINVSIRDGQTVIGDGFKTLDIGENTFEVIVTAPKGNTETYTVKVYRNDSDSNYLSDIHLSVGNLIPTFDKDILDYEVITNEEVITITPILEDSSAKLEIKQDDGTFTETNSITIDPIPDSTEITIKVTNSKSEIKEYVINIIKQSDDEKITSVIFGHEIDDTYVRSVKNELSPDIFKTQFDNNPDDLKLYLSDNTTEFTGNYVATGMILKLIKEGEVKDSKIVIVLGDTNADGRITTIDAVGVTNHILGTNVLVDAKFIAADTNKSNSITTIDAVGITNHILGTSPLHKGGIL